MLYLLYEKKYGTEKVEDVLAKYVDKNYFVQFSDIEKLGINPKSKFNTPLGIYAYPLTKDIYQDWLDNTLPFAGNRKHIILFKPTSEHGIVEVDDSGRSNFDEQALSAFIERNKELIDKTALREWVGALRSNFLYDAEDEYSTEVRRSIMAVLDSADTILKIQKNIAASPIKDIPLVQQHYGAPFDFYVRMFILKNSKLPTPFGKFWYLTYKMSRNLVEWRKLLVQNGINGVVDYDSGIIHPNEPTQAVFFISTQLKLEAILDNNHAVTEEDPSKQFIADIKKHYFNSENFKLPTNKNDQITWDASHHLIKYPSYAFEKKALGLTQKDIQNALEIIKILKARRAEALLRTPQEAQLSLIIDSLIEYYMDAIRENSQTKQRKQRKQRKQTKSKKKPYGHGIYPSQKLINMFDY